MKTLRRVFTRYLTNRESERAEPFKLQFDWMAEQRVSLAFTFYQAGKLFLLGLQPNGTQ